MVRSSENSGDLDITSVLSTDFALYKIAGDEQKSAWQCKDDRLQLAMVFLHRGKAVFEQRGNMTELSNFSCFVFDPRIAFTISFLTEAAVSVFLAGEDSARYHIAYRPSQLWGLSCSLRSVSGSVLNDVYKSLGKSSDKLHPMEFNTLCVGFLYFCASLFAETRRRMKGIEGPVTKQEALRLKVEHYLLNNLTNPEVTLETVSKGLGVSSRYLVKAYEPTGISVMARLKELRLSLAAQRLREHRFRNTPIAQIAKDCGFSSAEHFCRVFKDKYKVSAMKWRNQG